MEFYRTFSDQIPLLGYYANSADPVQTPQKAASEQGQHCFLTGISVQNAIKNREKNRLFPSAFMPYLFLVQDSKFLVK